MSFIRKPLPGGPVPAKDTRAWQQIQDVVNAYHSGKFGKTSEPVNKVPTLRAIAPRKMAIGDIAAFPTFSRSPTGDSRNHIVTLEEIEWHSNISRIAIASTPAVGPGAEIQVAVGGFLHVNLSENRDINYGESYATPDPDDPGKLKTARSGMFEVLFFTPNRGAVINTSRSQPYWRYRLESDWSVSTHEATAALLDINGRQFADSVTLTDDMELMDDQGSGDEGICLQISNKFIPIQANCE